MIRTDPEAAAPLDRAAAIAEPVRLGIIGLGAMGRELLAVAAAHPDVRVVLGADLDHRAIDLARSSHCDTQFTVSPLAVIHSVEVEAVYVATPPRFHAEYVLRALSNGKAVFCEKPLAVDLSEGEAMVAAANETGLVNAVNFALADRHAVLEVERALLAGEVGDVRGVDIRLGFPSWPRQFQTEARWLAGREQGGFVREVLTHFIYVTDRLVGPLTPMMVKLESSGQDDLAETGSFGVLEAGGVTVSVTGRATVAIPESYDWYLYGTRRSYWLRDWGQLLVSEGGEWREIELVGERGSEATRLTAFATAVRGQPSLRLPDFATALRIQRVVEAFHR